MILQSDNPVRMVRELKGAGLSIVIAMGLVRQPVTQEWLERNTGYTDKTVSQALQYLQEHDLAAHTQAGWIVTSPKARQLVMALEIEGETPPPSPQEKGGGSPVKDRPDQHEEQSVLSRNNSDSLITTTINNNQLIDSVVVSNNNAKKRRNSDFEANLEEFKQQGIARNKRTEALARMSHVNPGYIRAHLKGLKKTDSKGLAIMRMEQGEEAPERTTNNLTPEEIRAKYAEWEK